MAFLDRFKTEKRTSAENPQIPISAANFLEFFGGSAGISSSGVTVTIETALGVPSVWAAVNFLAGTLAGMPLNAYKKTKDRRDRITTGIAPILHDAINDEMSSFDWRKSMFEQVLTGGRAFTFIERNAAGVVINFWPLDPNGVTVKRSGGRKVYQYKDGGTPKTYAANEIIDLAFMLKADGLSHRGPIVTNKDAIGMAIAATEFGSKFFQNGGVPPFAVTGNFQTAQAIARASEDFHAAVKKAAKEQRQALVLPVGLEIKTIGVDAEKSQLIESQRFSIEQIARIYSLPPVFLQDLTHGTFSNTEQQDLHFVKHTVKRWVVQFEQELNLKLFGRANNKTYVEMNMDGLLRGDFKTRMDGYAIGVQNGILKPNEARKLENRPDDDSGDNLMIQGATVPIKNQLSSPITQSKDTNVGT